MPLGSPCSDETPQSPPLRSFVCGVSSLLLQGVLCHFGEHCLSGWQCDGLRDSCPCAGGLNAVIWYFFPWDVCPRPFSFLSRGLWSQKWRCLAVVPTCHMPSGPQGRVCCDPTRVFSTLHAAVFLSESPM